MKPHALALLPLCLLATGCFTDPYAQPPRPLYRGGPGYAPSYSDGGYRSPQPQPYDGYQQGETGTYREDPSNARDGNQAPPVTDPVRRPIPDSYDPEEAPAHRGPSNSSSNADYPVAERTGKPNMVRNPYPPHEEISVDGIKSGHKAHPEGRPEQIFIVP